jgi:hypothetical protein
MNSPCGVILSKVQAKRYQPVRRQKGIQEAIQEVVAMLTKKNKVRSSQ